MRSRALPIFREGDIPADRDIAMEEDQSGFLDVLGLLLRSWPYIRPQVLGHWYVPHRGVESDVADLAGGAGYRFTYAPFIVAILAIVGPLLNWVPLVPLFPMVLLYVPVVGMALGISLLAARGALQQSIGIPLLVLSGIGANVSATVFISGWVDGFYAALVTCGCLIGWMVQHRRSDGRSQIRIRVGTHLIYYYAINFTQRFIGLALGLVLADLLYQNVLQSEAIAPGLASLLGVPEWAQGSIQELTSEQRHEMKWVYVIIVIGAYLLQLPLNIISPYYNIWIMQRINQDLRVTLMERWHQLSLRYHSEHRSGDSIFRIYQDSAQVTSVIGHLINLSLGVMSYVTCIVLVSILEPLLGLIAATMVIPALLWSRWAMPRMRTRSLAYRAAASDLTSTIQESFSAVRLIKAYDTADREEQRFNEDSVVAFNAAFRVRSLIALVTIVMFTIAATFFVGAELLMAVWAHRGELAFATELIGLIGISFVIWNLASFSWSRDQFRDAGGNVRSLLRGWMTAQDMAMGLRRVFDILDLQPDVTDKPDAMPFEACSNSIQFRGVHFAYQPGQPILEDVTFRAKPGTITAIIGPTGSGKSTLMALLLRLFDPDTGSIAIDDHDIKDFQVASLRRNIAIALQENVLFALSVRDNVRYAAPEATDAQVQKAIHIAAMDDYIAGLPEGLDTLLSDRGGRLSTGQRQRLSIARAIVRDAPILILDEPTAALDAVTEHQVLRNLAQWAKEEDDGRVILLVTHRISTVRQADNIIYLDQGRVVEQGRHEDLITIDNGYYRAFVEAESSDLSDGMSQ